MGGESGNRRRAVSLLQTWWKEQLQRSPKRQRRVLGGAEYRAMISSELMLADLCIRNHLFSPTPDHANLFDAGVAEGRRRAVLELLLLVRDDPTVLSHFPRAQADGD